MPRFRKYYVLTLVSAVDVRENAKETPQILPVLVAAKTFTDGTKNVLHMVISLPEIKGSSIVGYNLTADADQPYPLGALECSLSDLFTSVNPYGWNKSMDIPDGRFLKYVPDGFLDEMQKLAKEYALIEQKQYDRRKTIDKYLKMKRESPADEAVLQQLITEKETEEANENARLEEIISRFRELAQTDGLAEKWMESFAREYDVDLKGISLSIDINEDLLRIPLTGRADQEHIGGITLFPNAFRTKEDLLWTIFHEKIHVEQFKEYGIDYVTANKALFEKLAYDAENEFIAELKKGGYI